MLGATPFARSAGTSSRGAGFAADPGVAAGLAPSRAFGRALLGRTLPLGAALLAFRSKAAAAASTAARRGAPLRGASRKRGDGIVTSATSSSATTAPLDNAVDSSMFGGVILSLEELLALAGPAAMPDRLAHSKERLFPEENAGKDLPELLLFRDNSSWCPYCERVWLQLEEKKVPYRVEKINMRCYGPKPAWFLQMVPSGLLPVIKLNGRVVTESLDIMLLIEEAFPDNTPLLPSAPAARKRVQELLRLERQLMGAWLQWGSAPPRKGGGGTGWLGRGGSPFGDPQERFENTMVEVDQAIAQSGGPYFLGDKFSFVDAVYAPFIERVAASVPFWKGLQVRHNPKWPHINKWMDSMDSRPTYKAIKSDDFTITHTLEPQIGPVVKLPEGAAYRDKIEGKDGSWDLPLKPEDTAWGHDDGTGEGGAKEEAAQALLSNHDAVVAFALRSIGRKPSEAPQEAAHVSAGFRHVAHALLQGVDAVGAPPAGLDAKTTAVAAAYLRDRVGVPRDLRYPAARQLRAHLQWLIRSLGSDL